MAGDHRTLWRLHSFFFAAALLIVGLSATMNLHGSTHVALPALDVPLPELCLFRRNLGIDCPGCGLTRSFIAQAHGDFQLAWHFNPAGILLFPFLAFQIPYQAAQLLRLRSGLRPWNLDAVGYGVFGAFFLVMLVQWVMRMLAAI